MSREFAEEKKRREEAERQRAKNASSVSSNMQKPGASYTGSYQQRRVTNDKSASNLRNAQQNRTNTVSSNRNSAQTNTQQIQPTNYRDKTSQRQHKVNNDKSMANFEKTRQESIAKRTSPDPWEPKPTDAYGRLQKVGRNAGEVAKESLKRVYYGDVIATNEDGAISYSDDRRGVFDQKKYEESRKENKARQQEYIQKRDESEQRTADITRGANGLEKAIYDAVDSGTGMVADSAFGPLSLLHMGVRTAGSYRGKAMQEGATDEEDLWNSVMHGALEATTERFFRGIGVASKVTGGRGLSPASALANRLTRRMGGRAANAAQLAIRYGVGIGEENAEEILSALAENPMEEAIYKGAVRGRKADDIHSQLVDQSNQFRSQITSPEQAEMASAYLSSPDFIEENIKMYKEAGIPADQATQMAEAMRDYLAANLSGDVDKMADIESRLVNDIAGKRNLLPDLGEMRDTIAATTLLTGVTGLPGMVKTTDIGSRIKAELGDAKLRALANSAINFEDEEASMSAQAIKDRLDAGQEITASQAYELSEALEQQMAKNNEKEAAYFDTARRIISENNDNIPFRIDENGNTVMDEMTAKSYNVEKANAWDIVDNLDGAQVEGAEALSDEDLQKIVNAIAGFKTGVFTSNDIDVFGYTNTLARSAFKEATGIDLNKYTVYKKNGQIDYSKTNAKQSRALFALAADNLVESARVETANWIDTASGAALESVTKRMDGNGSAAVISALDNVDIRDKNAYMYNLTAADTMYSMARRMPLTWEQARDFSVAAFRGADESMLQEMYEAGRMDREAAEDDARGIQTVIDQAISKGKESGTAYVNGKFTDERTDKSKPIKKSDMKIFQDIAQQLNINIAISDSIQGNGQYSPKTGKITLNAASTTEQNLGYIFMHETTHHLRLYAPEHWNKLVQLVKNRWSDVDPDRMNAEIDAKIDLYKKATDGKQILSRDQALEEIIADSAHEFLLDENFAKEVCAEDMGLAKSILNSIRSTLEKLRTVIANNYSDDTRMRSLFSELDILEEAERLWLNAYSEAYKNNMAVGLVEWNERNGQKLSASVRNSFGEGGYNGRSMSNRAVRAYINGERPISKWTREDIVDEVEGINDSIDLSMLSLRELRDNFLKRTSWHHTGAFYNATDFYSIDEDAISRMDQNSVDDIIKRRTKKTKTQEEREADRRNRDIVDQSKDLLERLNIILESGSTNVKTIRGLVNRASKSGLDIDDDFAKALDKIRSDYANRVKQWRKLPDDNFRHEYVELYDTDIEAFAKMVYNPPSTKSKEFKLVKEAVEKFYDDGTRYSISEEQDRAYNEDIRFSFDGPVERVKDLVAVHNLKQDDIQNALKLGGFPMPSIAVTKDNMGHEMYGDVTLMFHSDTIDPKKNKENKVYGGDAYTPVFPSIRFKPSEKIANNIRDIYYDNVSTLGYDAMNPMYRLANNIENELNDAGGESALKEKYKNNTSLMRTFLKMNDKDVEDVISRTESSMTDEEIRLNQTLIDSLGEDVIRSLSPEGMRGSELMEHRRQWVRDNKEALENAYTEYFRNSTINFSDEQIRGFLDDMKPGAYVSAVRKALTYLENGPTTIKEEIDRDATEKKIKQAAAENGYEAWVDSLLDGVEEKQGIRNNADAFTRSGSRRKWESLHDPVTLENVVRVMKSELDAGGNGLFGANPKGASQKKYRNLDDVRADEKRLQQLSDEEYKKQSESALSKFTSVCQSIYEHNKDKFYNPFGATMDIGGGIAEVLNETRTRAGIKSKLTKEFNWNVSDAEMDDLMNAIDAIANVPTGYFEAKPRRAVGFDEVKAAIVPDGMDRNVLDSLRDRGVSVYEYDPAKAGDRTEKVNEAATDMDLRFSISEEDNHDYAENQIIGKSENTPVELADEDVIRYSFGQGGTFFSRGIHAYSIKPTEAAVKTPNRKTVNPLLESGKDILERTMRKNMKTELLKQGTRGAKATDIINEKIDVVMKFFDAMNQFMIDSGYQYTFIGLQNVEDAKINVRKLADGTVTITMSAMVKNSDYPVNFDFTTICKKRQAFNAVIEGLAKNAKNGEDISLSPSQLMEINNELRKAGVETACLGCFVESRRYNMQNYTNKVVNLWNSCVDDIARQKGIDPDTLDDFNFAKGKEATEEDFQNAADTFLAYENTKGEKGNPEARFRHIISSSGTKYMKHLHAADLVTTNGIKGIRDMSTRTKDFLGMLKSAYGQGAPKETIEYVPYNSEIALLPNKKGNKVSMEDYLKKVGGVRMQSFSDFLIANTFDYMQMVADMAARGFPAHAYTKEIAFARIFGMTGIKINMSVMFDVEPQEFWGKVFHEADYQKQKTLAEKYAGMTFYKNLEDIPEEFVDYNAEGERIVKPGGSVMAVTENGVSGYVTYLVGDENRSNREWEKVYRNALAEGLDEEAARQRANEMRRWIQSINFSDAKALQKQAGYGKNCGIIGVGVSDINILVMLDDDNVPYIIPYHASGLPEVIKSLTNLNHAADYTNDQNTRIFVNLTNADGEELGYDYVRKLKKDLGSYHAAWNYIAEGIRAGSIKYNGRVAEKNEKNKDGENYDLGALGGFDYYGELEKGKNPREAAEAYLAYCDEYGLLPVFPRFVGHQNYYKLLLDFSVTDLSNNGATSPQGPVRNIYPGANLEEGAETYDDLQNIISDEMQKQNEINQYRDSVVERVTEEFSSRMSEADEDTEEDTSDIRSSFSEDDIISQIAEESTDTENIPREDAKDEEDRRRKAKSKEDFFAHMNAEWNERWLTEGKVLKKESVIRDIRQLVMGVMQNSDTSHQYKTKLVNSTMKDARNAFRLIKEGKWDKAGEVLYDSALYMLEDAEFVDDSLFKQFKEVRDYLRHTEIFVGDEVKAEFEWDRFYKENRARMLLKNGDTNIDKVFMELAEMVPGEFNQDEVSNPADQLSVIANFLDRIQPYRQAYDSQTASELAFDIAEDLFNIVYQQGESYQSVADTYKARYDELTKKMKAEHQNAIRKIREQERDKRNKLRKEFTEKRKAEKAADKAKAEHKLMYKSIQKNVKKLSDLLTKETDEKHVPEPLRGPLGEMLTYFDLQKEGSKIWESKHGVSKAAQKLRDLREAWQKIADESDIGPFEYDEEMLERIQKLIKALDGKGSIDSLENKEMDIIDDMLAAVLHQLNVYEAVIKENQRIEVEKIANPFIESMYERIRKYGKRSERTGMIGALFSLVNEGEETPPYFFDRLGGGMQDMYNELRRGNDKHIRNMNYLRQRFQEICGGHENRLGRRKLPGSELEKWRSAGSLQKFDLAYGTIELTPAQIMSVYCLSQRQQAMNHMLKNGIVVAPVTFTASISEDIQSNIKGRKTDTKPIPLTEADIDQIKTALTEDQKKMADEFMKLLNEDMRDWGNETSLELLGYQKFREKTYFPIKSADESLTKDPEKHNVVEKIRSFSFTKGLTKNANNAIMVEDIFSVVADHCNKMSLYNAFAVPIRNFMKVFNYKRYDDEGRSTPLKQVLADAFGRSANDYILKFIDDLNGNTKTKSDPLEAVLNKTLANYKRASIGANVRVALQQPTAIMRAFMVLNPKYFAGIKVVSPAMTREMQEHCPIALWKSWGHYDVDMGRDIEEVMMNNDWSIGDTLSMGVYGALDNWTWTMIWQACKNEVKEKNPNVQEGTDEFWELCNKRASEVFDKTQVVDSIFHRSETMRSKNIMTKMMVSFMAEPTLTYNVLRDAAVNARERLKDGDTAAASALAARAVIVFLLNTAAVSASAALWDVVRGKDPDNWLADLIGGDDDDDEEEKTWGELFIRNFFNNVSDNGNLLNNIYFVKDIWGLRDGFGTSNMALEGWELLWKGIREYGAKMGILEWTDLREKEKTWYEMNQNFFGGLGYITGKPVKTLMKDLKPLWDMIAASAFASTTPGYQLTLKDGTEIVTTDYNEYIDKLEQYRESGELDKQSQQDVVAFDPGRLLNNMISDSGTESVRDREEGDVTGSRESYQSIVNAKKEEQEAAKEEKKKAKEEAKADSSETGETKSNKKPAFAKMAQSEKIADLKEKYSGLSKEERTKKVWDKINDGYREMVEAGDYKNISHMRAIMLQTGCDVEMFDQKIFEASKRALKKSIKVDATEKEIAVMEDIRGYLEAHGITQEELSNIAYKSETAKDVKAAMRLNDHDAIVKELVPLVRAGLSREDYERLWKYRNSGKASYTGKYAEREKEISTGTFNWPAQGVITSGFGYRRAPVRGASTYHQGIDIGGSIGDPIAASDGGTVTFAGWNGGYGYQVVVKHYDGSESLYSHLDSYSVQPGQVVSQGDQIARMGSTGTSSGPHLDFRIRVNGKFVNPMEYLGGVVA